MQSDEKQEAPVQVPQTGFVFHPGDTLELSPKPQPVPQAAYPEKLESKQAAPIISVPPMPRATETKALEPRRDSTAAQTGEAVSWTASEYVAHEKGSNWYLILAAGTIVFSAFVYLMTQDRISSIMVIIVSIVFGTLARKQPRVLQYSLDETGIIIGNKGYPYEEFKSFSVVEEGAMHSFSLMPMRRFMPVVSIYFAPEDEDKILNKVATYLPFEPGHKDMIEQLMRRIRF